MDWFEELRTISGFSMWTEIKNLRRLSNIVIEGFSNYQDYVPKWYKDP